MDRQNALNELMMTFIRQRAILFRVVILWSRKGSPWSLQGKPQAACIKRGACILMDFTFYVELYFYMGLAPM